jgi:hypothetical protein
VASGGAILFRSGPVNPAYMQASSVQQLEKHLASLAPEDARAKENLCSGTATKEPESVEDRLTRLLRQRNNDYQRQMETTLQAWRQTA